MKNKVKRKRYEVGDKTDEKYTKGSVVFATARVLHTDVLYHHVW